MVFERVVTGTRTSHTGSRSRSTLNRYGLTAKTRTLRRATALMSMALWASACSESSISPTAPSGLPEHRIGLLDISCPAAVQVQSFDGRPVRIDFTPATTGGQDPVIAECTPASGSPFSVGTTQVSCVASDALEQVARCRFRIRVLDPPKLAITRFLAFGNSITAGVVAKPGGGHTLDRMAAYPSVLRRDLTFRYRAQNIQVVNASSPGEWAANAIHRFREELRRHRPQGVLLMEGTNDVDQIAGAHGLDQMVLAANAANVDTLLMTIPPQHGLAKAHRVPIFNEKIRAIAARRGVVLVDVYRLLFHGACSGGGPLPCIGTDGLHPTAEGYRLIAEELARVIVDLYDVDDQRTTATDSSGTARGRTLTAGPRTSPEHLIRTEFGHLLGLGQQPAPPDHRRPARALPHAVRRPHIGSPQIRLPPQVRAVGAALASSVLASDRIVPRFSKPARSAVASPR